MRVAAYLPTNPEQSRCYKKWLSVGSNGVASSYYFDVGLQGNQYNSVDGTNLNYDRLYFFVWTAAGAPTTIPWVPSSSSIIPTSICTAV
jgi:hypothetical protein